MGVALEKTGVELSLDLRFAASCIRTSAIETVAMEWGRDASLIAQLCNTPTDVVRRL